MEFIKKLSLEWSLRIGLGIMYLYSGWDLIFNPEHWLGFVPQCFSEFLIQFTPIENYLKIQGFGEILIGFIFLAWFIKNVYVLRVAVFLAFLEIILILIFVGIDLITFRDIGLLGAMIGLLIISLKEGSNRE